MLSSIHICSRRIALDSFSQGSPTEVGDLFLLVVGRNPENINEYYTITAGLVSEIQDVIED